jgi:hypothetical protein
MKRDIPLYKAEIADGLGQRIRSSASIVYASKIEVAPELLEIKKNTIAELAKNSEAFLKAMATNEGQIDLFYLKSILATVGWNRNDDVFDKKETWVARYTPEDKPFNYEHNQRDIIGHITGNYVLGADGNTLADDLSIDDLPDRFHVVTSAVLYKYWADAELMDRMKKIIDEIPSGKWFVSMEALFTDFAYAVVTPEGKSQVIERDDQSAFLTKHLRAYGGNGVYQDYKVGRLLRNIVFSGKGLVRNPANPDSIIFDKVEAFEKPITASVKEFTQNTKATGYTTMSDNNNGKESVMPNENNAQVELLQSEIKRLEQTVNAATAKAADAEKRLNEMNEQTVKAKIESLTNDIKERDKKVESLTNQVTAEQNARTEAERKLTEANDNLKKAQEEVAKTKANAQKVSRLAVIKDKLGLADAEANDLYETVADLSDERFDKLIAVSAKKATQNNNNQTDKTKDDGAGNANAKVLDNVQNKDGAPAPTLGTGTDVNDKVNQTQAALGSWVAENFLSRKSSNK